MMKKLFLYGFILYLMQFQLFAQNEKNMPANNRKEISTSNGVGKIVLKNAQPKPMKDSASMSLLMFTNECSDKTIQIYWVTENESNIIGYEIEKSLDGTNYNSVEFIPGNREPSGKQYYSYVDDNSGCMSYYRLKFVDVDGLFTYSYSQAVNCAKIETKATFNCNFTTENLEIFYNYDYFKDYNFEIHNLYGKLFFSDVMLSDEGKLSIPSSNFPKGLYFITLFNNSKIYECKALK